MGREIFAFVLQAGGEGAEEVLEAGGAVWWLPGRFGVEGWTNTLPVSALKQISTAIPEVFISVKRIVQRSGDQLKLYLLLRTKLQTSFAKKKHEL